MPSGLTFDSVLRAISTSSTLPSGSAIGPSGNISPSATTVISSSATGPPPGSADARRRRPDAGFPVPGFLPVPRAEAVRADPPPSVAAPLGQRPALPSRMGAMEYRIEHDTMGEVRVPASAKWAAQTQRAVENFPISGRPLRAGADPRPGPDQGRGGPGQRRARGASRRRRSAQAIAAAAEEVAAGRWDDQFPIDVFQTGSGTSSNMNVNEVMATLATERLGQPAGPSQRPRQRQPVLQRRVPHRPSTWPRRGPSPTTCCPALAHLEAGAAAQGATSSPQVVKSGRTHLMDATPVTLGQEFGGYAAQVAEAVGAAARDAAPASGELPARRHGRRHRAQRPARLRRRGSSPGWPRRTGPAAGRGARPLRRPGRPRRAGRAVGPGLRRWPSRCTRSPTTCAGWRRARAPAWPRSACPTCSPARRSCPARSTR